MSDIISNIKHNKIGTLNQYFGIDGKNVDQQNTPIKTINNCDGPIDSFTGRSTELSELRSKFNEHNIVVIHGVGGVGKTQLARKFAAVNKNNYNCVFWLQAEFQESLRKQLRELALELNIEDGMNRNQNQIRNEIYDILKIQKSLLIFDNTLNDAEIKEYLPAVTELKNTKLHILITSQFLDWNQKTVKCLPLIHLDKIYALELLNKILNTSRANAKDREKLVYMLEYMPLAIQIAASYINTQMKQNDNYTITRYIEKLTNDAANIHMYKHVEYGKTLDKSIKMSLDIIREDNSYAMELVYIMAFHNPDSITKEILLKILKINSNDAEDDFCEALQIIINYSLIGSFNNILHLHRTIQEIIRDELIQIHKRKFLKYYELVLDYVLNNEDQISIRNSYVFKYAKDYTEFILQYYKANKSAKLLRLLCEHGCLKNVKVIFTYLKRNKVKILIERHGLLHCATFSSDIETVKIICKCNKDVNMTYGTDNTTSLHIACMHGYVNIADFLIEQGADTNMKCENGRIALHYASSGLHYDIVCRLLRIPAINVEERDKKNQTPLQQVLNTHKTYEINDKTVQIARLLVEKGANPDTTNDESNKVIHIAAHNGNYEFLAHLLDNYNLDVNVKNKYGNTPLLYAVAACKLIPEDHIMNTIKLLIKNGADVETINNNGYSLLHIALFASKSISEDDVMATVKLLIANGANVETISNGGRSVMHVASEFCHEKIISYLIQEHNVSVDTPENNGQSPLFCALFANKSISEDDVMATVKLLIANGANVETTNNSGSSLMHVASEYCHDKIISYLIQEHNISVDTPDNNGQSPLFCALLASKSISEDDVMATVKLLIAKGANVETINNGGSSLMHVASKYCHGKIISYLIQEHNISVDTPDNNGLSPLYYALIASKSISEDDVMATVKLLISNGANVETTNNRGRSLMHAASEFCHEKIISYLIQEHNISVDTPDHNGLSPLFCALLASKSISEDDVMATVKLLIANGANVETTNNSGWSLMHVASEFCHEKIICYLIQEHNISVDTPDNNGQSPLFCALFASKSISEDDVMATVKLLIANGADVETTNNSGWSLMHVASQYCHDKIISYLIQEHNISVDTPDINGQSPLFCALIASKSISEDDVMATVKLLIAKGANVETTNNRGRSLMHVASEYCHEKIISYLIQEHNISVDTPGNNGQSPLFCALLASKSISEDDVMATVKLLIANGANVETIDNSGCSLMHVASWYCREKIICYFIQEHNISVDTPDNNGLTPLFYALLANKSISEDDVMATVKLFIANGANVETTNNSGWSLMHVASLYCHDKIICYLIQEHNISVDTPDNNGQSPLFCALLADKSISEDDVLTTIKLLIAHGATVESTDNKGCMILHYGAQFGRYQVLNYLLHNYNLNIDTQGQDGDTPLHCALLADESIIEETVKQIINKLLFKGASINLKNNKGQTALDLASPEIREFILKSYTKASNRRIPEITQQEAKRRKN